MHRLLKPSYFLLLICFMISCNAQIPVSKVNAADNTLEKPDNSIIYVFFEINKNADGSEKVTHTETKVARGFMKNDGADREIGKPGNIRITMQNSSGEMVEERVMENPLNPVMEVYGEDGLSKQKINLPRAEFSVRFNQKGNITAVKVEKLTETSAILLLTLKL